MSRGLQRSGISRDLPLLAAVSGGADSLALLHALVRIGQRVGVAHVHHGLRGPAADADLAWVEAAARRLGLRFHAARIEIGRGRPGSWEARAREARYAALEELRRAHGYAWVATAHTLDDQAETVLLRALRGTRLEGLAAIESLCAVRHLVRPALELRREQLRAYLRARSIEWREDESNRDPRHSRNRLRQSVLPELEAIQPRALEHLAALAEQAGALRREREAALDGWLPGAVEEGEGGRWIDAAALRSLAAGARRAALAGLLRRTCPAQKLRGLHLERALEFVENAPGGRSLSLPGHCSLLRDRDAFWLGSAAQPRWPDPFELQLEPGLDVWLPERRLRLHWRRPATQCAAHSALRIPDAWLGADALRLRSPRARDQLIRGEGTVALRSVLQRTCSLRERRRAAVVANAREVLWVAGLPGVCDPRPAELRAAWELVAERVSGAPSSC